MLPPSETFPRAKAAATRALQRDDSLPHAHAALAYALVHHEWNWSEAEREYKRALQLPPPSATVHDWYGTSYLVSLRRFDEAETEVRRALEVEPVTLILQTHLGWVLYFCAEIRCREGATSANR